MLAVKGVCLINPCCPLPHSWRIPVREVVLCGAQEIKVLLKEAHLISSPGREVNLWRKLFAWELSRFLGRGFSSGGEFLLGKDREPVPSSGDPASRGLWCHLLGGRFSTCLPWPFSSSSPSSSSSSFLLPSTAVLFPGASWTVLSVGGEGRGATRGANTKITLWLGRPAPASSP